MVTLIALYAIMLANVIRVRTRCRKLLLTSLAICTVGILIALPQILLQLHLPMRYKEALLFTVTMFYISPLCDSVIYYCSNPLVQERLPDSGVYQTARRFSRGISNLNLNVRLSFVFPSISEEDEECPNSPTSVRSFAGRLSPSICYHHSETTYRFPRTTVSRPVPWSASRGSVLSI